MTAMALSCSEAHNTPLDMGVPLIRRSEDRFSLSSDSGVVDVPPVSPKRMPWSSSMMNRDDDDIPPPPPSLGDYEDDRARSVSFSPQVQTRTIPLLTDQEKRLFWLCLEDAATQEQIQQSLDDTMHSKNPPHRSSKLVSKTRGVAQAVDSFNTNLMRYTRTSQ